MRFNGQKGFTLIEVLISLILITLISVAVMGSLGPWLSFKEKLDTQRKLTDLQTAIKLAYAANAMAVDSTGAQVIQFSDGSQMRSSTVQNGRCLPNAGTWQALKAFLPEGPTNSGLDGFQQPFCVFVSNQLSAQGPGATIYYHNIAIVSLGTTGVVNPGTSFDVNTGAFTAGGQNTGVLVNGYDVQLDKMTQTQKKLDKLSSVYETYFTAEYLSTASRDVTVDYFANSGPSGTWDTNGSVPGTSGFEPANAVLQSLGIGPQDALSPYESNNTILVNNTAGGAMGTSVRSSSATSGSGQPPYTALLIAPLPSPGGTESLVEVVTGNY